MSGVQLLVFSWVNKILYLRGETTRVIYTNGTHLACPTMPVQRLLMVNLDTWSTYDAIDTTFGMQESITALTEIFQITWP